MADDPRGTVGHDQAYHRNLAGSQAPVGQEPAAWVSEMIAAGNKSFYSIKEGATYYYDIPEKSDGILFLL